MLKPIQVVCNTRKRLKKLGLKCTIQLFSALRKEGLDELAGVMGNWYDYQLDNDKIVESNLTELDTAPEDDHAQDHAEVESETAVNAQKDAE